VQDVAEDYLFRNGFDDEEAIAIQLGDAVDGKHRYLEVTVETTTPTGFAKLFGINELTAVKSAAV
jgi:hypothetical protein